MNQVIKNLTLQCQQQNHHYITVLKAISMVQVLMCGQSHKET